MGTDHKGSWNFWFENQLGSWGYVEKGLLRSPLKIQVRDRKNNMAQHSFFFLK